MTGLVPEARPWSREENEATIAQYFRMLCLEIAGQPFNKAALNRELQAIIGRSRGAIEFKFSNVSALMIQLGYPYVDGYQPRSHTQELLRDVVLERLAADNEFHALAREAVDAPAGIASFGMTSFDSAIVEAPQLSEPDGASYERLRTRVVHIVKGTDYLEREARNRSLGLAGEEFVLQIEHERLWTRGEKVLAEKIEHVSKTKGDGAGYDIQSFEVDGTPRLIEVKTTRYGRMTPFFASRNEVEYSSGAGKQYSLYRVFKFDEARQVFVLPGPLTASVLLEPMIYRASFS